MAIYVPPGSVTGAGTSGVVLQYGAGTGATWVTNPHENQLASDERLMALLKTYTPVKLPDTVFPLKLTWCLEHCQSKFRDISTNGDRVWYFELEGDATLFALKWA